MEELFWIIVTIIAGLARLLAARKKEQPPAPPRRLAAPPAPPLAAGQGGGSVEEALRREVEEFLRRAQGSPPQKPSQRSPQKTPQRGQRPAKRQADGQGRQVAVERPTGPRRLVDNRPTAGGGVPVTGTTSAAASTRVSGQAIGSGVGAYVDLQLSGTKAIAQHAQQLGEQVAQADNKIEAHLRDKFVHQLGSLQHQDAATGRVAAAGSPAAQQLMEMLRQPGGARQLVIASEILRRPVERWGKN